MTKPARKKSTMLLRLEVHAGRAGLFAADEFTRRRLKEKGFHVGDQLSAELRKARNPKFHRLVHALGQALIANTDDFASYTDAHAVLKRLQIEANVGCDVTLIKAPGIGMLEHRTPHSIAFENMDEGEFQLIWKGLCDYVIKSYWSDMEVHQIEALEGLMGMAA